MLYKSQSNLNKNDIYDTSRSEKYRIPYRGKTLLVDTIQPHRSLYIIYFQSQMYMSSHSAL